MSRIVEKPRPMPLNAAPKQIPSGINQLTERSVGNPGSLVIAANVPANAIIVNTGIAIAGKNAEGRRRMFRMPRNAKPRALRIVVGFATDEVTGAVVNCVLIKQPTFGVVLSMRTKLPLSKAGQEQGVIEPLQTKKTHRERESANLQRGTKLG